MAVPRHEHVNRLGGTRLWMTRIVRWVVYGLPVSRVQDPCWVERLAPDGRRVGSRWLFAFGAYPHASRQRCRRVYGGTVVGGLANGEWVAGSRRLYVAGGVVTRLTCSAWI